MENKFQSIRERITSVLDDLKIMEESYDDSYKERVEELEETIDDIQDCAKSIKIRVDDLLDLCNI